MEPQTPRSLLDHLRRGKCVLFAGAGLSAWGNLPTWTELLTKVVQRLEDEANTENSRILSLRDLIDAGRLLEVAEYCKDKLGARLYSETLSVLLRPTPRSVPEAHQLIAQLPFAAIVTTNFDKLFEQAYTIEGGGLPPVATHTDTEALGGLLFGDRLFILKAHGDIDRPETLVSTRTDYRKIIHSNPAFDAAFSALLLTNATLFIGYSLSDPDFRLLMDRQLTSFKDHVPERYALMRNVGEVEREILYKSAGIRVLPYDEHPDVVRFLQNLVRDFVAATIAGYSSDAVDLPDAEPVADAEPIPDAED